VHERKQLTSSACIASIKSLQRVAQMRTCFFRFYELVNGLLRHARAVTVYLRPREENFVAVETLVTPRSFAS